MDFKRKKADDQRAASEQPAGNEGNGLPTDAMLKQMAAAAWSATANNDPEPVNEPAPKSVITVVDRATGQEIRESEPLPIYEPEPAPKSGIIASVLASLVRWLNHSRYLLSLYGGLAVAFVAFYALADYTAYTTAEQRPGQLIFSNTMTQLWTACFRLVFILGASLALLRLFWPELFRFFRPDTQNGPDMMTTIKHELTSYQRLCVFLLAFFGLCLLFIALLLVNLPQTVSVGR
ncbi:hypothetical protein [Spirosoma oryzicola]|uniref:hypothetical protein n=1 Tax=Spirosoma oryzicola TaxID=2898794 RepID=UPI001E53B5C0|nr:hypothetical protein [Spirosoma oryzicola]UHG93395.1 hypothetical protein LQ777_10930 [Spirosoma oryzicola]